MNWISMVYRPKDYIFSINGKLPSRDVFRNDEDFDVSKIEILESKSNVQIYWSDIHTVLMYGLGNRSRTVIPWIPLAFLILLAPPTMSAMTLLHCLQNDKTPCVALTPTFLVKSVLNWITFSTLVIAVLMYFVNWCSSRSCMRACIACYAQMRDAKNMQPFKAAFEEFARNYYTMTESHVHDDVDKVGRTYKTTLEKTATKEPFISTKHEVHDLLLETIVDITARSIDSSLDEVVLMFAFGALALKHFYVSVFWGWGHNLIDIPIHVVLLMCTTFPMIWLFQKYNPAKDSNAYMALSSFSFFERDPSCPRPTFYGLCHSVEKDDAKTWFTEMQQRLSITSIGKTEVSAKLEEIRREYDF